MTMSTVKEICEGVPQSRLDSPISDIHIAQLASVMTEWEELAPFLNLTPAEEREIVEGLYQRRFYLQKREALRKWKEKHGSQATNRRLIVILCTQGKVDLAEMLKNLLLLETENQSKAESFSSVIDIFRSYLHDCYSDLPHPSSLQWPFSSNQSYVELKLIDVPLNNNSADTSEHHKPILLKFLLAAGNSEDKRKVVLVEGVAGAGKTTLSWYACKEWAAGRLFEDIKLLIHVSLGDPTIQSAAKLADLIPHPSKEMRTKVAEAIADKRGKGVCFLLEGCDEAPTSVLVWKSFLYRFIAGTGGRSMLPDAHIILTSRPGIPVQLTKCLIGKVIIRGFQSPDHFFNTCSLDNRDQLLEALMMKPELYSLCHLPLNAAILTYLYDILKDNLPTTRTGLFDPLVRNFLVRHIQTRTNYEVASVDNLPEYLPDDIRRSLNKVSELAYRSLLQRKKVVDQKMLSKFGLTSIDNALGFLRVHRRFTTYGPTKQFSFIHLSLQEFLAAFHISQMDEVQQVEAVKSVFDQNPLSPVLTFYAGITRLVNKKVHKKLFKVLNSCFDIANIVKKLELDRHDHTLCKANDPRRQLLALMNCVYETQNSELLTHIVLPVLDHGDQHKLVAPVYVNGKGYQSSNLSLTCMILHPTDCLSVGYFIRHASSQMKNKVVLDIACCLLGDTGMKALTQELHKPASKHNVILSMNGICISTNSLHSLNTLFNPYSCLVGLKVNCSLIEDINLAMKYFIEGFGSHCKYLGLYGCCSKMVYHLILLLRCPHLRALSLALSTDLFASSRLIVMHLFSEALKYSSLLYLSIPCCSVCDDSLMLLADAVCHEDCKLLVIDIDHNPYTEHGLTHFLELMLENVSIIKLVKLSVDYVSDEHNKLVELINGFQRQYKLTVTVGCTPEEKRIVQDNTLLRNAMRSDFALR